MRVPIDPTVMKAYRDALAIPASPSFIDTDIPIQPVAVIASASTPNNAQNVILTDGTTQVLVSTGGALSVENTTGKPGSNKTSKCLTLQQTPVANTAYTIHTVTAGKTFYVKELSITSGIAQYVRFGAALTGNAYSSTRANADELVGDCAADGQNRWSPEGYLAFTATTVLQVMASGTGPLNVTLIGWEQ